MSAWGGKKALRSWISPGDSYARLERQKGARDRKVWGAIACHARVVVPGWPGITTNAISMPVCCQLGGRGLFTRKKAGFS
jgi:hypothetical protein